MNRAEIPMKNANKLRDAMSPGRVYRRQDLAGLTTAVDRDLKTLVSSGAVKKLSGGLYYRPAKNPFGVAPPDDHQLVAAFLKTNDFRLTSYDHYNHLGLGLTQLYNTHVVYNHKRSGEFTLGGKRFLFRLVPAYPKAGRTTKEYLLVDMLNNLKHLPDDVALVRRNLKAHLSRFNRQKVHESMAQYGTPSARRALNEAYA